jgi:hypothetical protein
MLAVIRAVLWAGLVLWRALGVVRGEGRGDGPDAAEGREAVGPHAFIEQPGQGRGAVWMGLTAVRPCCMHLQALTGWSGGAAR